jgi:hypothetical protein
LNETTRPAGSTPEEVALRARNLRTVGALAAVFVLPLLVAFWMYYGGGWRPAGQSNHGELIAPPIPLERTSLPRADGGAPVTLPYEAWTLVYIADGTCDEACRTALLVMRQTRLALNQDMTRLERVWLATGNCCDRDLVTREHQGLVALDASTAAGAALLAHFPETAREHAIFVVDPLGNLMMRHDARSDPKGLLSDLKKLLKLSHIG